MNLNTLGWSKFFSSQIDEQSHLIPARVSRQDLNRYQLLSETGAHTAVLPGRMRSLSRAELPTVGDWVLLDTTSGDDPDIIQRVLVRRSRFSRKSAGEETEEQVVAANIDVVFIVTGLDDNFNASRIERYLVLAWDSGADPVIVLNKADVCDDLENRLGQVRQVAMGTPVLVVSGTTGQGVETLAALLSPGHTGAFLGSSGVGKSTLTNQLLGEDYFETGSVRTGDSKGRHTTTHREMCITPQGALLIDTPGMRELQLWKEPDTSASGFDDVEDLAMACRFTDCQHESEPGCAIVSAIEAGRLDQTRLDSYRKYNREIKQLAAKQDLALKSQAKKERIRFAKSIRKRPNKRD